MDEMYDLPDFLSHHLLTCLHSKVTMKSSQTADVGSTKWSTPAWLERTKSATAKDQRIQPWKKMFPNTAPIDLATTEPEYIILTLDNNVQENGRSP